MKSSSKMKDKIDEEFARKDYFDNKVVSEVRSMFSARAGMFKCKMNFRSDPQFKKDLWFCGDCSMGAIDTLSHVLINFVLPIKIFGKGRIFLVIKTWLNTI